MNARCHDEKGNFKACPYRVITEEYPAVMIGAGSTTVQEFYSCIGEKCIGYHAGICLRLHEALQSVK